ncbi:DNA repair protein RecO [Nitratireductor basaltis]|uniref:DNA repair protein RecO n=1 Tax=Nitratireductor basaltis TaxID=472175 RepID=A0A084UC98_9HYPH|nr:DNA repair protein RecO [Nitratireductor basaltis]KFB10584.1 Recombination protein O [Nitratireductor basaltis]
MEWHDEGIVLGSRKHGETSAILEVMTAAHGRHLGLVRGGRSRRLQPVLQPGNRVTLSWRARLDEHLGSFQVEPVQLNAARLMESALAIHGIQLLGAHLRLLPERDPHPGLFTTLEVVTEHLHDPDMVAPLMARFELAILEELGFGLDLSRCALTGATDGLAYVSPKTGRAVTHEAGAPWADKLLPLPSLISRSPDRINDVEGQLRQAFALTGYFLHRDVYEPRGMEEPTSRAGFIQALMRSVG